MTYTSPVDALSLDLIDIDFDETYNISVYDSASNLLSTKTITAGDPGTGNGIPTTIGFSVTGISMLVINGSRTQPGGFGLAFDNFNTSINTSTVPLPAAFPLLGSGLTILGMITGRKRKSVTDALAV